VQSEFGVADFGWGGLWVGGEDGYVELSGVIRRILQKPNGAVERTAAEKRWREEQRRKAAAA
jgi:hypothetical protein